MGIRSRGLEAMEMERMVQRRLRQRLRRRCSGCCLLVLRFILFIRRGLRERVGKVLLEELGIVLGGVAEEVVVDGVEVTAMILHHTTGNPDSLAIIRTTRSEAMVRLKEDGGPDSGPAR